MHTYSCRFKLFLSIKRVEAFRRTKITLNVNVSSRRESATRLSYPRRDHVLLSNFPLFVEGLPAIVFSPGVQWDGGSVNIRGGGGTLMRMERYPPYISDAICQGHGDDTEVNANHTV